MAKETIIIDYNPAYFPFALKCDDIKGIIKLHKNSVKSRRKITTRDVPITLNEKWAFHNNRSGWDGRASYITKDNSTYDYWEGLMFEHYRYFRDNNKVEDNERKDID